MSQQTFSDRLKNAMEKCNYKQSDLIRIAQDKGIKLGKSQVSQYVSGKTTPRPDVVALLAQILDVREDWLSGASVSAENRHATLNDLVTRSETLNETPITSDELPETSKSEQRNEPISDSQSTTQTREFKKSSKLDNVLYDVRGPVVDEAARMERQGMRILKLNIGNPAPFGFRTPDEVVQDMRHQLPDCEGYSDSKGLFSARKAIMQYSQIKGLPNVDMTASTPAMA